LPVIDPDEVWEIALADGLAVEIEMFEPGEAEPSFFLSTHAEPGRATIGADVGDGGRLGLTGQGWVLRSKGVPADWFRVGARFADPDGSTWVLASAARTALGTAWECQAVRLPVAADFAGVATVRRVSGVPGTGGLPTAGPVAAASDVPCTVWVDRVSVETDPNAERFQTRATGTAYMAGSVALEAGDTVETGGVVWDVVRPDGSDRLGIITAAGVTRVY
jgi:hypothetical protein